MALTGKLTAAVQRPASVFTERLAGQVIAGFSVSFTVTWNVQLDVFPEASVAVAVTVVAPTGNVDPEAGEAETVAPGQLSVTGIWKLTTAPQAPGSLLTVMFAGQVSCGASLSATVTVKVQLDVFPAASVAVATTFVVPRGNADPEAGTLVTLTPGQLSIAGTLKLTTAEHIPGSLCTERFAGQVMVGGC